MKLNFITNIAPEELSGGWSGISASIRRSLSKDFELTYVGPINPASDYRAKLVSKLRRLNGRQGSFHFFSQRRLTNIARLVEQHSEPDVDFDFFHGPTPWILCPTMRPFFIYTDTCFSTYIEIYHNRSEFLDDDLKRIYDLEAKWLARAEAVFFGTEWALGKAAKDYSLMRSNLKVVGTGGGMPMPARDEYRGGMNFLFVAHDFERKGGRLCVAAFREVRARFPEATLTLIGGQPSPEVLHEPGVSYTGFLRKTVLVELSRLQELYATAFALLHPTTADIQPLVLTEAGYHGCPSLAPRSFGIPELIEDGVTGYLLDPPPRAEEFAARMLEMCRDRGRYESMRRAARSYTTRELTWDAVGRRITAQIHAHLGSNSMTV